MNRPLVVGAGPAGCAVAIRLARAGASPRMIDRHAEAGDTICGGFLSWQTAEALRELGFDPAKAGAHRVDRLSIFAAGKTSMAALPEPGFGLSRRHMDGALRILARESGSELLIDHVRQVESGRAVGDNRTYEAEAIFLASGKHDVRGMARPRAATDPTLGLRVRCKGTPDLKKLLEGCIELHLFDRGYAGIVLQEEDSANICLAVRKSLLTEADGDPASLLARLADRHPAFAERMAFVDPQGPIDTIAAVPYGWRAEETLDGIFRLGDQAAVIPSLAGEGMGIALASAEVASQGWIEGGAKAAPGYQRRFAARSQRPVRIATALWNLAERPTGAAIVRHTVRHLPVFARLAMRLSRI